MLRVFCTPALRGYEGELDKLTIVRCYYHSGNIVWGTIWMVVLSSAEIRTRPSWWEGSKGLHICAAPPACTVVRQMNFLPDWHNRGVWRQSENDWWGIHVSFLPLFCEQLAWQISLIYRQAVMAAEMTSLHVKKMFLFCTVVWKKSFHSRHE